MALKFLCSNCQNEVIVKFLNPGEPAQCKVCNTMNIVPENAVETEEESSSIPIAQSEIEASTPPPPYNPLGPKDLGMVLGDTFRIYGKGFGKFLLLTFVSQIPILLISHAIPNVEPEGFGSISQLLGISFMAMLTFVIYFLLIYPLYFGTAMLMATESILGRKIQLIKNVSRTNKKILKLMLGMLLIGTIYLIPAMIVVIFALLIHEAFFALFFILFPAYIYLGLSMALYFEVLLIEDYSVIDSLKRSMDIISGHRVRFFGYGIVFGLILIVPLIVVGIVSAFTTTLASDLFNILYYPLSIIYPLEFYFDVRARKEGYNISDLEKDFDKFDAEDDETTIDQQVDPI